MTQFAFLLPFSALDPTTVSLALSALALLWFLSLRLVVHSANRRCDRALAQERKLRQQAEAGNVAKREFLAALSHEIRTPMNAILGFTDLALKKDPNPELRDYLDTVHTSAEWLMHIVNDVVDFTRTDEAQLQLEKKDLSVEECIRSTIRILEQDASAKNLKLRYKIDPQIPPAVKGDATRLRQVIFNLVENAVKFTTSGSVMIAARLESKSADSVLLRIAVADTGIGIPPDRHSAIFEPLRQPARPTMGLGLAICRRLVTLMGGSIDVQSQLGAGSTFEFTAWFEKVRGAFEAQPQSAGREFASRSLSILVAEDSAANRRLIETLLKSAGHYVTAVADGKQALALAENQVFDLILMDIEMPEMNGLEATAGIRQSELPATHVPIYALTAHALSGDRERCLAGGMDGYLSKPINIEELLSIVRCVASERQAPETSPAHLARALRQPSAPVPATVEA